MVVAAPQWFNRMESIETYELDGSAMARIYMWQVELQIAEAHPFVGGGFKATAWPEMVNPLLHGIPRMPVGRDMHSIYVNALSEHGWIGLALFLTIAGCSWINCSLLIRQSRGRPDLAWANLLGRMARATLIGYLTAGAFLSQTYFRRILVCNFHIRRGSTGGLQRNRNSGRGLRTPSMRLRTPQAGIGTLALPKPDLRPG
jgi:putative inorganic carbon (hco3(-)) transporter